MEQHWQSEPQSSSHNTAGTGTIASAAGRRSKNLNKQQRHGEAHTQHGNCASYGVETERLDWLGPSWQSALLSGSGSCLAERLSDRGPSLTQHCGSSAHGGGSRRKLQLPGFHTGCCSVTGSESEAPTSSRSQD